MALQSGVELITFYSAVAKTASENGSSVLVPDFKRALITANITAVAGTSPTLIIGFETSEDDTTWFHNGIVVDKDRQGSLTRTSAPTDEAKITTVTKHILWLTHFSKYLRPYLTITGSAGQSFTITLKGTFYRD